MNNQIIKDTDLSFWNRLKNFFKSKFGKNKNELSNQNKIESSKLVEGETKIFREKMQKRAKKIDTILSNSESVLLLNCRNNPETIDKDSTDAELKKFAKRFSKIYPNLKKIYG